MRCAGRHGAACGTWQENGEVADVKAELKHEAAKAKREAASLRKRLEAVEAELEEERAGQTALQQVCRTPHMSSAWHRHAVCVCVCVLRTVIVSGAGGEGQGTGGCRGG